MFCVLLFENKQKTLPPTPFASPISVDDIKQCSCFKRNHKINAHNFTKKNKQKRKHRKRNGNERRDKDTIQRRRIKKLYKEWNRARERCASDIALFGNRFVDVGTLLAAKCFSHKMRARNTNTQFKDSPNRWEERMNARTEYIGTSCARKHESKRSASIR